MASYFDSSALLKLKPFRGSAARIVDELSNKRVLEEEFLVDPAQYLASRLLGPAAAQVSRARLNGANQLLFSIMSNSDFVTWLREYQEEALKHFEEDEFAVIDKAKIRYDFAKALAKFGDPELIHSVLVAKVTDDPVAIFDVIGNITGRPVTTVILFNQVVTQTQVQDLTVAGPNKGWAADVAVEVETLIYAVAVAAVFAVAVAAVFVGARAPRFERNAILRDVFFSTRDIANVADALTQRANELRSRRIR